MTYSLNEIEVTSKRAACGAGLDWGIAEDAGRAVRWLAERGLPGPELLSALLVAHKGLTYRDLAPQLDSGTWHAPAGRLCPLIAGSALCDRAGELVAGECFLLKLRVVSPAADALSGGRRKSDRYQLQAELGRS